MQWVDVYRQVVFLGVAIIIIPSRKLASLRRRRVRVRQAKILPIHTDFQRAHLPAQQILRLAMILAIFKISLNC